VRNSIKLWQVRIATRISRVAGLSVGWTGFVVTLGYLTLLAPLAWLFGASDRWSLYAIAVLIAASAGLFAASESRIASTLGRAWSPPRSLKLLRRSDIVVLVTVVLIAPAISFIPGLDGGVGAAVLLLVLTFAYVVVQRQASGRLELPGHQADITPEESRSAKAPLQPADDLPSK
jgi:hypothetical protein